MLASGYADRLGHVKEHDALLGRMVELVGAIEAEEDALAVAAALDLRSALAAHIANSDKKVVESERAGADAARDEEVFSAS